MTLPDDARALVRRVRALDRRYLAADAALSALLLAYAATPDESRRLWGRYHRARAAYIRLRDAPEQAGAAAPDARRDG